MAMTAIQQNLTSKIQDLSGDILSIKAKLSVVIAMHASEAMTSVPDADLQALSPFAHMTTPELTAAKNALDELKTAIGEFTAGTVASRLMKVLGRVPN